MNHIVKIVCGRGSHSNGRAVLKYAIPEFLSKNGFDFYNFERDGVVLVRIRKY